MKWGSCRLTSWSRWHTSTTLCFIKLQRYKLTSANWLQKLLLLTLRSLFQPPAAPPMFNSLPAPSAVTSDPSAARPRSMLLGTLSEDTEKGTNTSMTVRSTSTSQIRSTVSPRQQRSTNGDFWWILLLFKLVLLLLTKSKTITNTFH